MLNKKKLLRWLLPFEDPDHELYAGRYDTADSKEVLDDLAE